MGDGASLGDLELGQKPAGDKRVYVEWGMSEEGCLQPVEAEAESRLCHLLLCSLGQVSSPL